MKTILAVVLVLFLVVIGCKKKCGPDGGLCDDEIINPCNSLTASCIETCKTPELTDRSVCYLNCAKVYRTCWGD